jgi:hypothetical protein
MRLRLLVVIATATVGIGTTSAFAATLGVGSWHLWTGSQALTKGTCTVSGATSVFDTYVSEASPNSNFGNQATMITRASATGSREWMLIRFDLSSCALPTTGGADTATMKLVVKTTAGVNRTLTVTPVLATWPETVTWTAAQLLTLGSSPTTTFSTGTTNGATLSVPVTIDVDALIKSPTANYGWLISDTGSSASSTTTFNSVEASTSTLRPTLAINYEK